MCQPKTHFNDDNTVFLYTGLKIVVFILLQLYVLVLTKFICSSLEFPKDTSQVQLKKDD